MKKRLAQIWLTLVGLAAVLGNAYMVATVRGILLFEALILAAALTVAAIITLEKKQ